MSRFSCLVSLVTLLACSLGADRASAGDWPQWRGPNRDAVSQETGLLQAWTGAGPKVAWRATGLGAGYASVVVSDGLIFTVGKRDGNVFVLALEAETGKHRWERKIGETTRNVMSTPTVDGDRLYALDPDGDLVCLKTDSGEIVWRRNLVDDFGGRMMSGRGYGESPLVDGDKLVCTPGGADAMLVALDKRDGQVVWKCTMPDIGEAGRDGAGFSSIVITEVAGIRQYVQLVGRGVIGVDASNGRFLWGYNELSNGTANIPTPVVRGNLVFAANGYNAGSVLLKLSPNGSEGMKAEKVYSLRGGRFQNHHGGVVLLGDYVFGGHGSNNGLPTCIDLATGRVVWKRRGPGIGSAAVVYADGHLYFRYQNGIVALIKATERGYELDGTIQIPGAGGDSWAHPVIADGRLYLREQDDLWAHDLKDDSAAPSPTPKPTSTPESAVELAALRKLGVSIEPLRPRSQVTVSGKRRLYRYADSRPSSDGAASVSIVTLADEHLTPGGSISAQLSATLQRLRKPSILNLAGTSISDKGLKQCRNLQNLVGLDLELCPNVTDASLAHLREASRLRVLILAGTGVTNEGLKHLASMDGLLALDLEVCDGVTDAGCPALGSMKQLRALVLKKTAFEPERLSDAGLKHLRDLARLEILGLYGNGITDAGLTYLERMSRLRELDLSLLAITDRGLVHLKPLRDLRSLELLYAEGFAGPTIGDEGLKPVAGLTTLRSLNLTGARITDAGSSRLTSLKMLVNLKLVNTGVSDAGVGRLEVALPDCKITR